MQTQIEKSKQLKNELARKEQMLKDLRGAGSEKSTHYQGHNASRLPGASEEIHEMSQQLEEHKKKLKE